MIDFKNSDKNTILRHIYVDCSGTFYTGFNTGIQRTVKNIVLRSKMMEEKYNLSVIPVVAILGKFIEINCDDLSKRFYKEKKTLFDKLSGYYLSAEKKVKVSEPYPDINNKTNNKLKTAILSNIRIYLKNIFQVLFLGYLFFFKRYRFKIVKVNSNDLIFLPDTYWSFNVLSIAKRYKTKKGTPVITLIYDIIPIRYPQFFDSLRINVLVKHIHEATDYSDGFICISKYSRDDFENYLKKRQLSKNKYPVKKPIEYFYLGGNFAETKDIAYLPIRNYIENVLKNKNVYIMVGTIEPRKNHIFVLDVFEKLWEKGFNVYLIIVGAIGWNCDNAIKRFKDSKYFGSYLFVYHDINDAELKYLYKNSKALIIASIVEGFGFPLVEAAKNNINVFASDIPVFREIGGDYPVYFSLSREDDLMNKIISFEQTDMVLEKEENNKSIIISLNWDDSISSLFNNLIEMYETIKQENVGTI